MQPTSPDPKFDFMLKDQPAGRRRLPMANLPKPVILLGGFIVVLVAIVIAGSILTSNKNKASQPMVNLLARGQEIIRVSNLVQGNLQDPGTEAMAATASADLSSDQKQLLTYSKSNNITVTTLQLGADKNTATDNAFQAASQNNSLDQVYLDYLKGGLNKYVNDLQVADKSVAGPKGHAIIQQAYDGSLSLLQTGPLKD